MTIRLPTQVEQRAAEEALQNPEGNQIFFDLAIDDKDCSELILEGTWGSEDHGGIHTDFTLATRLLADDTSSSFAISLNGVSIPQMAGVTAFCTIDRNSAATQVLGLSARSEANRRPLNKVTEFPGVTPDRVVDKAMSLIPYYSPHYTRIDPVKEPVLYFQRPDAHFWPNEFVGDIFQRVEEQTPLKIRDNAWGGLTASVVADATEVKDYRHYNAGDFPLDGRWRPPPRSERRYSDVVVFKRNPDGSDAFQPEIAGIDYRGLHPPLKDTSLWVQLDDATPNAPVAARSLARSMAKKLARGVFKDSGLVLPFFDPLVELQDVFLVYEMWDDDTGLWDRLWMCWVESYQHDKETLATEVSYSAALIENDKVEAPVLAMAGVSRGIERTVIASCDYIGDLVLLDVSALGWTEEVGDLISVGEDAPTVEISVDLASITCGAEYTVPFFGEYFPNLMLFDGVSWTTESGDLLVIDPASSSGHAVESGDLITIS